MQLLLHQLIGKVWSETKYLHKISGHLKDKTSKIPYSRTYSRTGKNFWTFPRLLEFPGHAKSLFMHSEQKWNLNIQVWLLILWNLFFHVWLKHPLCVHSTISAHFNQRFSNVFKKEHWKGSDIFRGYKNKTLTWNGLRPPRVLRDISDAMQISTEQNETRFIGFHDE